MSYAKYRGGAGMRDYRDLLQIVTGESPGDTGLQDSTPGMSYQDSTPGMSDCRDMLQIVTGESTGDAGLQDSIQGMSYQDSIPHANLRYADLRYANLRYANLRFPILQDAKLPYDWEMRTP